MIRFLFRLVYLAVTAWFIGFFCYYIWMSTMRPYEGQAEGIVIFTGGDKRVAAGLELLAAGKADHLLISGVNEQVTKSELLALHKQDPKLAEKIDLGFAARDTLGNADETLMWVRDKKIQSLIIVTSHYHMPRALLHLGVVLPEVALYPYPVRAPVFDENGSVENFPWRTVVRDYNKLLLTYPQILFFKNPSL